ncbi:hypothetical protein HK44_021865 [Pseudomonas fluorescens HK44]|uniref:Uncharacterized protein n=1 Tax=Pseudomonas fluorescens HK44 TaxID=1042209 RepID=A0A010T0A3_PSEFL|nr:hypothetical protein HK44_021865 [Pseudomonas fluorescens HK44]
MIAVELFDTNAEALDVPSSQQLLSYSAPSKPSRRRRSVEPRHAQPGHADDLHNDRHECTRLLLA